MKVKVSISERLKERRFDTLDLQVKYKKETEELQIIGDVKGYSYYDVKTKDDVVECFKNYIEDLLSNP
jgi:hypothetical protein